MKKILITGSSGFIGFHLATSLSESNNDLGIDSIFAGSDQEVTLYLKLDLAPVTGFLICTSGYINAELMKNIIETIFNDVIGNIANGYVKFSSIVLNNTIKQITPTSVDNEIDRVNAAISRTNQLVIDKIGESLLKAVGENGTIFAHNAEGVEIKTLEKLKSLNLQFEVLNALTAPKQNPVIAFEIGI